MDEDEAALLAELRAISAGAPGTSRFDNSDDENEDKVMNETGGNQNTSNGMNARRGISNNESQRSSSKTEPRANKPPRTLPPWKRGLAKQTASAPADVEVFAAPASREPAESSPNASAMMQNQPIGRGFRQTTFEGKQGGNAEDSDLLAELQSISQQSGVANRFAGDKEGCAEGTTIFDHQQQELAAASLLDRPSKQFSAPKHFFSKSDVVSGFDKSGMDVLVSSHSEDQETVSLLSEPPAFAGGGGFQKSSLPNTFQGERGGAAEDADLLAELKAVSAQSASTDRFSNSDAISEAELPKPAPQKVEAALPLWKPKGNKAKSKQPKADKKQELPLWKRKDASTTEHASSNSTVDVVVAAPSMPQLAEGGFQKSSLPSTFQGDRGGSAEDADLLAELRAISSSSGAAGRFAPETEDTVDEAFGAQHGPTKPPSPLRAEQEDRDQKGLPPWKRKQQEPNLCEQKGKSASASVMVPTPPMAEFEKPSVTKTFQGDCGGDAEDEELLAELEAITGGGGGANRFEEDEEGGADESSANNDPRPHQQPKSSQKSNSARSNNAAVPPWQRKGGEPSSTDDEVAAAAPSSVAADPTHPELGGFKKSNLPNTFKGDRGGAAKDKELLAELMAISASAGGADRFADAEQGDAGTYQNEPTQLLEPPSKQNPPNGNNTSLPPWKKKASKPNKPSSFACNDMVISTPSPPAADPTPRPSMIGFQEAKLPNAFQGENRCAAEDEVLLAELRAMAAGSGDGDRSEDGNDKRDNNVGGFTKTKPLPSKPKVPSRSTAVPPWKRKGDKQIAASALVMDVHPLPAPDSSQPPPPMGGFQKSKLPNTFKGERGGAAEDEDLLAELRAISAGAGSADRFREDSEEGADNTGVSLQQDALPSVQQPLSLPKASRGNTTTVPPWKRKDYHPTTNDKFAIESPSPPPADPSASGIGGFQKSSLPNTFKGDRGGAAEDAALLAELIAISSKASSTNRFADLDDKDTEQQQQFASPQPPLSPGPQVEQTKPQKPQRPAMPRAAPKMVETSPTLAGSSAIALTMADIPLAVTNKSWKLRKEAFEFLHNVLGEQVAGKEPVGDVIANAIAEGLDSLVPGMLGDSNASALDSALEFSLLYADHCVGATLAGQAEQMTKALVKGSALSSSRPSTAKFTAALVMKLMEVGENGTLSANVVINVLLQEGLTSKKPKTVLTSAGLILQASTSFGAACLPLAQLNASAPKMLFHSNAKVRDTGMKILAEIARALGSTSHIKTILDGMKKAQVDQLNSMLQKQSRPTPPSIGFRSQQGAAASASPEEALAALEAGKKEMEAKQFASRPSVNLVAEVAKSEYSTRIQAAKWSDKVAALDIVMECGGEKPYKLMEHSSSVNYGPLISDMKKLLGNTHFAVCGKSMQVLSMLAEGVGSSLFPHLRPLLGNLLALGKDKKLTKFIGPCLDSLFGRILSFDHVLEPDAIPEGVNEKKQKNALARSSALDFLARCVARTNEAGPRGVLSVKSTKRVADLSVSKLEDSDAGVRKAALAVLQNLQNVDKEEISDTVNDIIDRLKATNTRAHKTLSKTMKRPDASATKGVVKDSQNPGNQGSALRRSYTPLPKEQPSLPLKGPECPPAVMPASAQLKKKVADVPSLDGMTLDEALEQIGQLGIPNFDGVQDDGGILAGLQSTKWSLRQNAIRGIAAFVESADDISAGDLSNPLMVAVKEHTRGFRETNVNVIKAVLHFFVSVCDLHYRCNAPLTSSSMVDIVAVSVEKIADRKLSGLSKVLLTNACLVSLPLAVVKAMAAKVEKVKSPLPHEECQRWFTSFCNDFGATSLGNGVKDVVDWLLKEASSSNVKVRKATFNSIGRLHVELGPIFKALLLSQCQDSMRDQLEKTMNSNPHDLSFASADWPKVSIVGRASGSGEPRGDGEQTGDMDLGLEIPRMDLFASIPADCLARMASKESKTAWKLRKQAIDEVDAALKKCSALIDTSPQRSKQLGELTRTLRDRLSDSQGNLKPLSARVIGTLLSLTDRNAQVKLGKLVYGPLINGAISDIKKPMREAALEALRSSTRVSSIEGGGLNKDALEGFVNAMASELNDTAIKGIGLPDLLDIAIEFADQLPNLDELVVGRGQSLAEKASSSFVKCLTSSKSDTRSKGEALLTICAKNGVLSMERIKGATERMKPAQQRSVGPILAKIAKSLPSREKETVHDNDIDMAVKEPVGQSGKPSSRGTPKKPETQNHSSLRVAKERKQHSTDGSQNSRAPKSEDPVHPLIPTSGPAGPDKLRSALRLMTWPEYPEEPLGSELLNQLKRAWGPILPHSSVVLFFPQAGIRKQDDGKGGCELITKAILTERAGEGVAIEEQLELIFRWMAMVLCSKEHTVGLQALLTSISDLFVYLHDIKYELSDSESLLLIPFVLEKASLAKGRFKDVFYDLMVHVKAEDVLPMKRLGSVVSVAIIERASHAKARVLACRDCIRCVDQLGLSGIGKKGVLVAAKALSDETLPENRSACLDLMEAVLARMNGDIQRLARICGSNLSDKARRQVEERWNRCKTNAPRVRPMEDSSARRSKIPTAVKASPAERLVESSPLHLARAPPNNADPTAGGILQEELPALVLRQKYISSPPAKEILQGKRDAVASASSKSFLPKFCSNMESKVAKFSLPNKSVETDILSNNTPTMLPVSSHCGLSSVPAPSASSDREGFRAAASLRARLLKIREKNQNPDSSISAESPLLPPVHARTEKAQPVASAKAPTRSSPALPTPTEAPALHMATAPALHLSPCNSDLLKIRPQVLPEPQSKEYQLAIGTISGLSEKPTPLTEGDKDLDDGIECMKKFHAALSKQQSVVVGLSSEELLMLRQSIVENVDEIIERLSRLMHFSLDCEVPSRSAGISVSLLSVCLATLMALFRDHDLAVKVSTERLVLLIRETGTALLDPRLVVSSQTSSLDEATSTQVVRAINKLAVQAATGGSRVASLNALLTLQHQLFFEESALNARLSRVVTKLFARVIKAEDTEKLPWASVDKVEVLKALDSHFAAFNDRKESAHLPGEHALVACERMAKMLVESMAKTLGGALMQEILIQAGIDVLCSPLCGILTQCTPAEDPQKQSPMNSPMPCRGVATLVSSLGGAQTQLERDAALLALRQYTSEFGDQDLNLHLEQVSPVFRNFILEQLSKEDQSEATGNSAMAERLRNLRSRLHAKDQTSVSTLIATKELAIPATSRSCIAPPSTLKFTGPPGSNAAATAASDTASLPMKSSVGSSQSLRERLAAAQESRKNSFVAPETTSTSGSRAAALRARLQAVKQQAMESSK